MQVQDRKTTPPTCSVIRHLSQGLLTLFVYIVIGNTAYSEPTIPDSKWWVLHEKAALPPAVHQDATGNPSFINSLITAETPYLIKHAYNPINWITWEGLKDLSEEDQDKPLFISIGYSSCHWCHVMERESFENLEIAAFINKNFVPVLIDREQHPAVDHSYMTAAELTLGQGGWPLTVFALQNGAPFFLDLYQPPGPFLETMRRVEEAWRVQQFDLIAYAAEIQRAVSIVQEPLARLDSIEPEIFGDFRSSFASNADFAFGGFGQTTKFPQEVLLSNFISALKDGKDNHHLEFLKLTLKSMASGGLHDHIGGGFYRYTVDPAWTTPHFEKMLYNQAGLLDVYTEAYALTGEDLHKDIAIQTADALIRDFQGPNGRFYSAYDADSNGVEGLYYLWREEELGEGFTQEERDLARLLFGVDDNYELEEGNILLKEEIDDVMQELRVDATTFQKLYTNLTKKMFEQRSKRELPFLDKKAITAWNAMDISSLVKAGYLLRSDNYLQSALSAAESLWLAHFDENTEELLRFSLESETTTTGGNLDDHTFLGLAMLDLFEVIQDDKHYRRAVTLAEQAVVKFWDAESETFYLEEKDPESRNFVRAKILTDRSIASGNSAALRLLSTLDRIQPNIKFKDVATRLSLSLAATAEISPSIYGAGLRAVEQHTQPMADWRRYSSKGSLRMSAQRTAAQSDAVVIKVNIKEDWHVNGHKPTLPELVGTTVRLAEDKRNKDWWLSPLTYPDTVVKSFSYAVSPIAVYEKDLKLTGQLVYRGQEPNPLAPIIEVTSQACDAKTCLPPETTRLVLPY